MNRRRLLQITGALLAGGAGGIGSGAFSSLDAQRSVQINVSDDDDAYLALDPRSDNIRATVASGEMEFYIPGLHPDAGAGGTFPNGDGVNPNSSYEFGPLLDIRNQGEDTVEVFSAAPNLPPEFATLSLVDTDRGVLLDTENSATELRPGEAFAAGLFISVMDADLKTHEITMTIIADPADESSPTESSGPPQN